MKILAVHPSSLMYTKIFLRLITVATIANSALPLVLAACRAMLLCLAKGILLTFLASFWVLEWNGDGAKVGQAGRAARASH